MLLTNLLALMFLAVAFWATSLRSKNVNVVDVGWGLGFVLVAWLTWAQKGPVSNEDAIVQAIDSGSELASSFSDASHESLTYATVYRLVVLMMVTLWGLRLSSYLLWRSWGKSEDYRYAAMREHWGDRFAWRSLFTVFLLQSLLIWFISLCVQLGISGSPVSIHRLVIGVVIWTIGLVFESVGDWQLMRFKRQASNKGKVMNRGLWRWTRHPNYFGDFLVWWGIYCVSAQSSSWWGTITGPALMSFLLIRVSGVSLLESSLKDRLLGYREYVQNTSSFFPWFPKQ